jgi:hypothetical protein
MEYQLGEVIATRELSVTLSDGSEKIVIIKLGTPLRFQESDDYYAPFQIVGMGSETVLCAGGIDAFQAIQEVMKVIGAQLMALQDATNARLTWKGAEGGALGFPVPPI